MRLLESYTLTIISVSGTANAMSILGPVIGYIFGGYLLSIYVDFDVLDPR